MNESFNKGIQKITANGYGAYIKMSSPKKQKHKKIKVKKERKKEKEK